MTVCIPASAFCEEMPDIKRLKGGAADGQLSHQVAIFNFRHVSFVYSNVISTSSASTVASRFLSGLAKRLPRLYAVWVLTAGFRHDIPFDIVSKSYIVGLYAH